MRGNWGAAIRLLLGTLLLGLVIAGLSPLAAADGGVSFAPRLDQVAEPVLVEPGPRLAPGSGLRWAVGLLSLKHAGLAVALGYAAVAVGGLLWREPAVQALRQQAADWRNSYAWGVATGLVKSVAMVAIGLAMAAGGAALVAIGSPLITLAVVVAAVGLVGLMLWAAVGIFKQRWAEQTAAGRRPNALVTGVVALLELLGPASIWEGATRRRLLTGTPIADRQAGELMGTGLVYTFTVVAASAARLFSRVKFLRWGTASAEAAVSLQAPKAPPLIDKTAQLIRRLKRTGATHGAVKRWQQTPGDIEAVIGMISSMRKAGLGATHLRSFLKLLSQPKVQKAWAAYGWKGTEPERAVTHALSLVSMEQPITARYLGLGGVMRQAGLATKGDRALLRAAAEVGVLSGPQKQALAAVSAQARAQLARKGAGAETLAAFDLYSPKADILRLSYMVRSAAAESVQKMKGSTRFDKGILNILQKNNVQSVGDRAFMRGAPVEHLPWNQKRAYADLLGFWHQEMQAVLREQGKVMMHKEIPRDYIPGMLDPGSIHNRALLTPNGYMTLAEPLADVRTARQAYHGLALWYSKSPFAPKATERFYIASPFTDKMTQSLGLPIADDLAQMISQPAGFSNLSFPSTRNGHTASLVNFLPEWIWNGDKVAYPSGTRIIWKSIDPVTKETVTRVLATVVKGRWVKNPNVQWP